MDEIALKKKANQIRNKVIDMAVKSGGHISSAFSCVEIMVTLYYGRKLNFNPKDPEWEDRDRFILSKGHGETGYYALLADLGYFPKEWLETRYRRGDCYLGGHPDHNIPGVEITSGSLGHGLGIAAGISLAAKMNGKSHLHYVLLGDAECTEGSIWEAALFAAKHELNNLIAIVDRNHIGSLDFTKNYTKLNPFPEKWKAFGWEVETVDGHSFEELFRIFQKARLRNAKTPFAIIAETIKGKGVTFIENDPIWHVKNLTDEKEIKQAKKELEWVEYENS